MTGEGARSAVVICYEIAAPAEHQDHGTFAKGADITIAAQQRSRDRQRDALTPRRVRPLRKRGFRQRRIHHIVCIVDHYFGRLGCDERSFNRRALRVGLDGNSSMHRYTVTTTSFPFWSIAVQTLTGVRLIL